MWHDNIKIYNSDFQECETTEDLLSIIKQQ